MHIPTLHLDVLQPLFPSIASQRVGLSYLAPVRFRLPGLLFGAASSALVVARSLALLQVRRHGARTCLGVELLRFVRREPDRLEPTSEHIGDMWQ